MKQKLPRPSSRKIRWYTLRDKLPDGGRTQSHACMALCTDIGRRNSYEQKSCVSEGNEAICE